MADVTTRLATGDDLDAVVEVGRRTWPVTYEPIAGADYVAMGLAKWWTRDATIPAVRAGRVVVAEVDGEVVGMASVGPMEGHQVLWKHYVLPEYHGRGIGSRLLAAIVERVRQDCSELRVSFTEGNRRARDFYLAKGFTALYREPGHDPIPDQIWMGLDLTVGEDSATPGHAEGSETAEAAEHTSGVGE